MFCQCMIFMTGITYRKLLLIISLILLILNIVCQCEISKEQNRTETKETVSVHVTPDKYEEL